MKPSKTYKSGKKRISIERMNSYHLAAAIRKIIRKKVIDRFDLHKYAHQLYAPGSMRWPVLKREVVQKDCIMSLNKNSEFLGLMDELHRRTEHIFVADEIDKYDKQCRLEWTLTRKLERVSRELRK